MASSSAKENKENLHLHCNRLRKNKPLSPFVSKLRFLLNAEKYRCAIHWSVDGNSIIITDIEIFKKSILDSEGDMFKTRNFTSFVRQLNLYGFRKVPSNGKTHTTTNITFEHVHFRRERPDLMHLVHRTCLPNRRKADPPLPTQTIKASSKEIISSRDNTLSNFLFVEPEKKLVRLTGTTSSNSLKTPLGVSVLHNLKTENVKRFTKHEPTLLYKAPDDFVKFIAYRPADRAESTSQEHDYALPVLVNKEMDEKEVFEFLNKMFSLEKEVVQTLLSMSTPVSQEEQSSKYDGLKILADVSESVLVADHSATPL